MNSTVDEIVQSSVPREKFYNAQGPYDKSSDHCEKTY